MRIEALLKALYFYNMDNDFQLISGETLDNLHKQLDDVFACQEALG